MKHALAVCFEYHAHLNDENDDYCLAYCYLE